ncbi:unnamed protein product [Schistosoma rodhaini]|uniref:Endonuclease n=1 Tax=Schistosoma rodhaini TaxID=6188 RepID=A0AA85FRM6_9TREM|nr:unnamed protein product [Schistosoma rodhaini]
MSITFDQFEAFLERHEKRLEQFQMRILEKLTQQMNLNKNGLTDVSAKSHADCIIDSIHEFHFDGVAGVTFESWYKKYEDVFNVDLETFDDAAKVRVLLRKLGTIEHERYTNYILPKNPRDISFEETVKMLSQIFGEQSSLFSIRYQCLKIVKAGNDDWVQHASIINRECERFKLSAMTEDQFKCLVFVCSLQSSEDADIRTRILSKIEQCPNITLQEVTTECQHLVNLKHDTSMVENNGRLPYVQAVSGKQKQNTTIKKPPSACWFCGELHYKRFCPYKNYRCTRCQLKGHKETCCKKKMHRRSSSVHFRRRKNCSSINRIMVAHTRTEHNRRKYVTLEINGRRARLQLDTASDISLISRKTWSHIGKPSVLPTTQLAHSASGGKLNIVGEIYCPVKKGNVQKKVKVYLTESPGLDLLGLDLIETLKLADHSINSICRRVTIDKSSRCNQKSTVPQRHHNLFKEELGECTKAKALLILKPGATPVFRPKRPVPYAALTIVEQELERLQKSGIIEPVNFSDWAAPIVIVKKPNGSIRLCADYSTGLNDALEDHQYPLPLPEDLFAKLNGGKYFAKLDLSEAYLQIPVAEECKHYLTINTHKGLFRYNRLPFGVKTDPSIFQQVMDTMLQDIPGTAAYLDDILIMGTDYADLEKKVDMVLRRIADFGFTLRAEKCDFYMEQVRYLGFIIDKNGRKPDPENVEAIKSMPPPTDVSTLRSFLGMVSHYGVFLPELHRLRAPLNGLLKKDTKWFWSSECQEAFVKLKQLLSSNLLLTHYDPELPIVVAADASNYGIGAVIAHTYPDGSEKAIAHAARSLTMTERNYSQIEKEALSIIFAVKKFHKMLFGRQFTLLTDHKPLLTIFGSKKGIPVYIANRLQRWATTLLGYDFKIKYQPTTDFGQADALSRLISSRTKQEEEVLVAAVHVEAEVHTVLTGAVSGLPVTFEAIKGASEKDNVLKFVRRCILNKWPSSRLNGEPLQFFRRRDSLTIVDSCIMFGHRIVIPRNLRNQVLKQFHSGHPGISKMKSLARSYAYWPSMDHDIEQKCRSCSSCLEAAKNPNKAEPQPWPKPDGPWQRIHADFAGPIQGRNYLVVVDAFTKWPEVYDMPKMTSESTIRKLTGLFACFGVPEILVTDNGTQFMSSVFKRFCTENGISHLQSPPYHPQSNGQAERFVDTIKRALVKGGGEAIPEQVISKFLLSYRVTPNPAVPEGKSPAECMFRRKIRTIFSSMLPPRKTRKPTNGNHMVTRSFKVGERVLVKSYQGGKRWEPGIIERRIGSVLYLIRRNVGTCIRHINQIRRDGRTWMPQSRLPFHLLMDSSPKSTQAREGRKDKRRKSNATQPSRVMSRKRIAVTQFQVDPRKRTYTTDFKGGRCEDGPQVKSRRL